MRNRLLSVVSSLGLLLVWNSPVFAQDVAEPAEAETAPASSETAEEGGAASAEATGGARALDPNVEAIESEASQSPIEKPGQTYYFVGLRYRGIVVPKFMMNLFGDGGATVYVHNFGPEAAIRKDNFEYVFSLSYAPYSMDWTPFKASSDPDLAWELVKSEIKVLYATVDFLWTHPLTPQLGLNFGLGAGFGLVWGDLRREQAYPIGNGEYERCPSPGYSPPGGNTAQYCGRDNDHYAGYTEASWADGGSKPIIFPWLAPMVGFRYKANRNIVGRLDLGFGTSGFFFGVGADYGI